MSYGSSRYGYGSYGIGNRYGAASSYGGLSSGTPSYTPTYSRRSGGSPSYGLSSSKSSSYLSPSSSPRSSLTSTTLGYTPSRCSNSSSSYRNSKSFDTPSYGQSKGIYKTLSVDSNSAGHKLSTSKSLGSVDLDVLSDSSKSESISERARLRFGSSGSIPDTSSEVSSRSEASRYSSRSSLNEDQDTDYKKLYEALKVENERLREDLKKTEEELEKTKAQLQKSTQSNNNKNSVSEIEKKERRALERKLSEMEEEIKTVSKLKAENEKLKAENRALSRVVCKLSK